MAVPQPKPDALQRQRQERLAWLKSSVRDPYETLGQRDPRDRDEVRSTRDRDQFAVWCIEHRQPVFINDVNAEHGKYIARYADAPRPLEDGTLSRAAQSMIYLPLVSKDRVLGVVTIHAANEIDAMRALGYSAAAALDASQHHADHAERRRNQALVDAFVTPAQQHQPGFRRQRDHFLVM